MQNVKHFLVFLSRDRSTGCFLFDLMGFFNNWALRTCFDLSFAHNRLETLGIFFECSLATKDCFYVKWRRFKNSPKFQVQFLWKYPKFQNYSNHFEEVAKHGEHWETYWGYVFMNYITILFWIVMVWPHLKTCTGCLRNKGTKLE